MKFAIPDLSADNAEQIWQATKQALEAQLRWKLSGRRIACLTYRAGAEERLTAVGAIEPSLGEAVLLILEVPRQRRYLVCSAHGGVTGGLPLILPKKAVRAVQEFEP
jgi:hypothetical protein